MKKPSEQILAKAYEIGVMKLLKEVAESGDDVHENHTPSEICDMMLDKVDLVSAKSILVLYNIELLFALRKAKYQGHVTFFTQSHKKAELAPKIFGGVSVEYIDKEDNPLYYMENKWPDKFDIVIANPPYSKKLDLKFLDKAFDIAKEEVVFVHPSTAFVEQKGSYQPYYKIREKIKNNLYSLEFFNGNGIFGIFLFVPCSITHLKTKEKQESFELKNRITNKKQTCFSEDVHNLSILGKDNTFLSLKNKIQEKADLLSLQDVGFVLGTSEQKEGKYLRNQSAYFVETSHIRGHIYDDGDLDSKMLKSDFYTILPIDPEIKRGANPKLNIWWEFETEKECQNLISFCKTEFARFCLSLSKINQNLARGEMKMIPAVDFTQEWTDEKLYAHFNITEEEQAFIKEVIPPYYD